MDRADKLLPTPQFINLGGPMMCHLRLVGFAILMLGNLDRTTAPTMDELYRVLLEATWLEALSVGKMDRTDPLSEREPLHLNRLIRLHFFAGGNQAFEQLLRLMQALALNRLDIRVMDERDCCSLISCAELVRPVKSLRIYGVWRADNIDLLALSKIMPAVAVLAVTTADRALARCAEMSGFGWTRIEMLHLRNPRINSGERISSVVVIANLRIHYPYPVTVISYVRHRGVSTRVEQLVIEVEGEEAWYATAH
ncbi:hypothetical protein B0H14DRAFT_2627007 [Mycena olivaceomarginata]|nr:hypothetical protein B0H14DRAFT_2627007 [Mycena olivaceomarginata]